ncbi:hypothetical protein Taro_042225 [Colocasia esculenta]|uniref:Uncharacterized protein n=1 Tax=Colocasia esculenta TaxID=4460 RepID=A0A843WNY8_COLES|nr:hypothetical protein [Colocasia esculenta]
MLEGLCLHVCHMSRAGRVADVGSGKAKASYVAFMCGVGWSPLWFTLCAYGAAVGPFVRDYETERRHSCVEALWWYLMAVDYRCVMCEALVSGALAPVALKECVVHVARVPKGVKLGPAAVWFAGVVLVGLHCDLLSVHVERQLDLSRHICVEAFVVVPHGSRLGPPALVLVVLCELVLPRGMPQDRPAKKPHRRCVSGSPPLVPITIVAPRHCSPVPTVVIDLVATAAVSLWPEHPKVRHWKQGLAGDQYVYRYPSPNQERATSD